MPPVYKTDGIFLIPRPYYIGTPHLKKGNELEANN